MEERIRAALRAQYGSQVAESAALDNLGGHASLRIYWRIHANVENAASLIAMVLPQSADALKSEEGGSGADPAPTELPFVSVQRYLDSLGVRVPAIHFIDMSLGVLLLEDLGDTMFENVFLKTAAADQEALYREAIDLLVDFQRRTMGDAERACVCWSKQFDAELLRWELDHYTEWGIDALYGPERLDPLRSDIDALFDRIVAELVELPQALALRDYQSRNIMRKADEWVLIDFQDALRGPFIYDLVALLRDSYIELAPELVDRLVGYYATADLPWCADPSAVRRAFYLQALQRKLKDTGRFVFIDKVKGNPDFMPYYAPSVGYVRHALTQLPDIAASPLWTSGLLPD